MHIPDGFLDTKTMATTTALSLIGVGTALRHTRLHMPERRIPLLGLAAAFVFAAQMLNFPVAAGTSGHLIGAVLISVLLGPSASIIVISTVLLVQCFLFADGGMLALGANIFNMAIVGTGVGYGSYVFVSKIVHGARGGILAVIVASLCSILLASVCCAGELAWSGTVSWEAAFPAMASVHVLIGLGEGLITSLVLSAISTTRPDFLTTDESQGRLRMSRELLIYGAIITLGLVLFVSPFASPWPDGLESVAARLGFHQKALQSPFMPPLISGYKFPGIGSGIVATMAAGTLGVALLLGIAVIILKTGRPKAGTGKKADPH